MIEFRPLALPGLPMDGEPLGSVQTDPSPDNERAIRSYGRAGFVAQSVVQTPDGPALLMLRDRR